ncbi:hypothetical protein K1W54_02555 [Micromonospora sp. CPCC 205371]|nr:hypothetical protein [Micromonospora sp. CPCC 205371]
MGEERRGVVLYGPEVDAVAEALRELDPRYVPGDVVVSGSGLIPVLCCRNGADADAARQAELSIVWLVVELYRPEVDVGRARDLQLALDISKVDRQAAARAIDQPDVVIWYEVINPVRVVAADGRPAAADYSNLDFIVPEGHRMVAHAVGASATAPECVPGDAAMVLPSQDPWALARPGEIETCQACVLRHGRPRATCRPE